MSRQCKGTSKKGKPCGAPPLTGGDWCIHHDPEKRDQAQAMRSRGGKAGTHMVFQLSPDEDGERFTSKTLVLRSYQLWNTIQRHREAGSASQEEIDLLYLEFKSIELMLKATKQHREEEALNPPTRISITQAADRVQVLGREGVSALRATLEAQRDGSDRPN